MRLLAVVVLYHPGKDLAGNINSYLPQVDRLLLWDNTPGGGKEQLPLSGSSGASGIQGVWTECRHRHCAE